MGRHTRSGAPSARRLRTPLLLLGVGLGLTPLVSAGFASAAPAPLTPSVPTASSGDAPEAAPCAKTVKACARLSTNEAWVTDGNGHVLRGPVRMTHGAPGYDTPTGTFKVLRKDATHVSQEQAGTPMPWSVFFDTDGRAFHGGSLARQSAGCVHLDDADAKFFFDHLAVGDSVQILP